MSHYDAHVHLGRLLHEAGHVNEGERHYRLALAARPGDCTAAFNLRTALKDRNRHREAIETYERAGRRADALRHLKHYKQLTETTARTS